MSCYVLWIPCLTNVTPSPIKGEIKDHNISDTDVNKINATIDWIRIGCQQKTS